jgi:hypothetical protein
MRHNFEDETGRPRHRRDEPLKDGERLYVPTMVVDSATLAADGVAFDHHKPGYRLGDAASADPRDSAYYEMVWRTEGAWRSDARREADTEAAAEIGLDAAMAADDAQAIRDRAYASYVTRVENMWRDPS